jgi:Putative DNA-binding domain
MSKTGTRKETNPVKKEFDNFFDSPTRGKLESFLLNHFGEQSEVDFKTDWTDFAKTAKHILAIANSGGGCIVVGVTEPSKGKLEAVGVSNFLDETDVRNKLKSYLPTGLSFRLLPFDYDDETEKLKGKKFQVILIENELELLPFVANKNGDELREGAIYVRRGTSSTEANYEEIQKVLNKRIETGHSSKAELDLISHIEQLKILFGNIKENKTSYKSNFAPFIDAITIPFGNLGQVGLLSKEVVPNNNYPEEGFDSFISRVIERKKKRIEIELEVENISD